RRRGARGLRLRTPDRRARRLGARREAPRRVADVELREPRLPAQVRRTERDRRSGSPLRRPLLAVARRRGTDIRIPDGQGWRERPMRSLVTVNNTDAYEAACLAGLGIIQTPRWRRGDTIERGLLVEVLPELSCEPMPVSLVHAHGRNVPKRVRA